MKTSFLKLSFSVTILLFLGMVTLFSCKKENSIQNNSSVSEQEAVALSEENAEAEASFEDVTEIGLTAADEEASYSANLGGSAGIEIVTDEPGPLVSRFIELREKTGDCMEITVTPNDSTYPKTVTIDFGDGCIGRDGKFRKGAIIIHFTAPLRRPGAVVTTTFRGFYLGRAHIEGTHIITNFSENGKHKFSVQVVNGKLTFPNGRGFSYNGLQVITQVAGMDTRRVRDDAYEIEGRSKTEYNNGTTLVLNTESPLLKKIGCPWLVQGVLKIKINARELFLDYGSGDCDNKATLKWSGGEKEIRLP
jgi:hypothetical protein